jgi:hypothetical protein
LADQVITHRQLFITHRHQLYIMNLDQFTASITVQPPKHITHQGDIIMTIAGGAVIIGITNMMMTMINIPVLNVS